MSSQVREIEAKLLLKKHDRRVRLLRKLERGSVSGTWVLLLLLVFMVPSMLSREWLSSSEGTIVVPLTCAVVVLCLYVTVLSRRIDALVELLQQEGMLQSQLPASHFPDAKKATTKP